MPPGKTVLNGAWKAKEEGPGTSLQAQCYVWYGFTEQCVCMLLKPALHFTMLSTFSSTQLA